MKRQLALSLVAIVLVGSSMYTPSASSDSSNQRIAPPRALATSSNGVPAFVTTLNVDRADDTAAASACTAAATDWSLRGAIRKANTTPGPAPVVITLQPATTYTLTISNAN